MILEQLRSWLSHTSNQDRKPNSRMIVDVQTWPSVIYAIGDVHGRYDLLKRAELAIMEDAKQFQGEKLIVALGDIVDRGPKSAQVLDLFLSAPPTGFRRICLMGNHEAMMSNFLAGNDRTSRWLKTGGLETLDSYGIPRRLTGGGDRRPSQLQQTLKSYIPDEHIDFLQFLPIGLRLPGVMFVHAGLAKSAVSLQQFDDYSLDLRLEALNDLAVDEQRLIVHGHHAQTEVALNRRCLNLDTGAYATSNLSFARFVSENNYTIMQTNIVNL